MLCTQILTPKISLITELILIKLETKNYHLKVMHYAKPYINMTMLVVWANTQFSTIWVFVLLRHALRSHQWTDFNDLCIIRRVFMQGCAFWGLH